jgi:hypothetical protein
MARFGAQCRERLIWNLLRKHVALRKIASGQLIKNQLL